MPPKNLALPKHVHDQQLEQAAVQKMRLQVASTVLASLAGVQYQQALAEMNKSLPGILSGTNGEAAGPSLNIDVQSPCDIALAFTDVLLMKMGLIKPMEPPAAELAM